MFEWHPRLTLMFGLASVVVTSLAMILLLQAPPRNRTKNLLSNPGQKKKTSIGNIQRSHSAKEFSTGRKANRQISFCLLPLAQPKWSCIFFSSSLNLQCSAEHRSHMLFPIIILLELIWRATGIVWHAIVHSSEAGFTGLVLSES